MRISDWSSDVCSSDLARNGNGAPHSNREGGQREGGHRDHRDSGPRDSGPRDGGPRDGGPRDGDRKSVVWGESVSERVDRGGRRFIKTKTDTWLSVQSNRGRIRHNTTTSGRRTE